MFGIDWFDIRRNTPFSDSSDSLSEEKGINPLHSEMALCQLWLNCSSGSGKEDCFCCCCCCYFSSPSSPWREGHDLHFKQNWIPFTQGCIVNEKVETGHWQFVF